jgi:hypothetical protein
MSTIPLYDFNERFGQLLLKSWTNEEFLDTLVSTPRVALEEVGLGLPESVDVRVERREALPTGEAPKPYTDADFQAFYDKWAGAAESGSFVLTIPESAELALGDMSDTELETISGGFSIVIACLVTL